jgi:Rrf2 family protein
MALVAVKPAGDVTVACVRISAKVDYAIRAMVELAAAPPGTVKVERIAAEQRIPRNFLENILLDLRHAELVASRRGVEGGYRLARSADSISIADVIRAVEGPLASVRGARPDELEYVGPAASLRDTWIELRAAIRGVLEETTLEDLVRRSAGES